MYLFLELKKKKNPQICTCAYGFLENTGREPQSKEAAMEEYHEKIVQALSSLAKSVYRVVSLEPQNSAKNVLGCLIGNRIQDLLTTHPLPH